MFDYLPDGWHSVTPRLIVGDPAAAVDFLKRAFAAKGEFASDAPSLMTIGDSIVMVSAGPRKATSSLLHLYVRMRTQRSAAQWKQAPSWLKSRPTCRMATAARWSRIRSAIFGRSQRTMEASPAHLTVASQR